MFTKPARLGGPGVILRVRITRPLSAGIDGDKHHLHISALKVYNKSGSQARLKVVGASPLVKQGKDSRCPECAIDGTDSTTHNNYGPGVPYGQEDHWMEFQILGPCYLPLSIVVEHNHNCVHRLPGCFIEVKVGSHVLQRIDVKEGRKSQAWDVSFDVSMEGCGLAVRVESPLTDERGPDQQYQQEHDFLCMGTRCPAMALIGICGVQLPLKFVRAGFSDEIALKFVDASPLVKASHRGPERAIDGDPSTSTHNRYGNGIQYGQETHWMEFELIKLDILFPLTIRVVHNHPQTRRFVGCEVDLVEASKGRVLHRIVVREQKREYRWEVPCPDSVTWHGPLRIRVTRPLTLGIAGDIHHLHLSTLSVHSSGSDEIRQWKELKVLAPFATPTLVVANLVRGSLRTRAQKGSFVEIKVASGDCEGHVLQRVDFADEHLLCAMPITLGKEELLHLLLVFRRL